MPIKEKKSLEKTYRPYYGHGSAFGVVPPRIGFKPNVKVITKQNYAEILELFRHVDYSSMDTETTGLAWETCQLVSINVSAPDNHNYIGFYYLGYFNGQDGNPSADLFPTAEELDELLKVVLHAPRCYTWNRYFDQRVLMWQRHFDRHEFHNCYDAMNLLWLMDTNVKSGLGLKQAAKDFLGVEAPHFEEVLSTSADETGDDVPTGEAILTADWRKLALYGAYDGYDTIELGQKLFLELKRQMPFILKLHLIFKNALFVLEEQEQYLDEKYLREGTEECIREIERVKAEFYEKYGDINLGSAKQKSDLLMRLGYDTGVYNKPGKDGIPVMSTKSDLLEKLVKEQDCDPARLMIKYSKLTKLYGSYFQVGSKLVSSGRPARFHFLDARTPTCRIASGKYTINRKAYDYFIPQNLQALPKPKMINRWVHYDNDTLDIEWHEEEQSGDFYVETGNPHLNYRRVFGTPPGYLMVKCDYCVDPQTSTVELEDGRIVPISYLENNPQRIKVPGGYSLAHSYRATGLRKKCRVTLKSGKQIVCSPDHKLAVIRGGKRVWVEVKDLSLDDYVEETDGEAPTVTQLARQHPELIQSTYLSKGRAGLATKFPFIPYNSLGHLIAPSRTGRYPKGWERQSNHNRAVRSKAFNPFLEENSLKYYLLGYILGDGNLYRKPDSWEGLYTLNITTADKSLAEQFASIFKVRLGTRVYKNKPGAPNYVVNFADQSVSDSLIQAGIQPRKSYVDQPLPDVPERFRADFARGLLDSDGCVALNKVNNTLYFYWYGNKTYLEAFQGYLPVASTLLQIQPRLYRVAVHRFDDVKPLFDWLYPEGCLCLERKRHRVKSWLQWRASGAKEIFKDGEYGRHR